MKTNLTFEQLPEAVSTLSKDVSEIKRLLLELQDVPNTEQSEQFLTIEQAAEFLKLSVATLYSKVSRRELPHLKRGKRLYFSQSELIEYLQGGRVKTAKDISQDAEFYLKKKGLNYGK